MPYKDPERERQRSREKHRRRALLPKVEGLCSRQPDCKNPVEPGRRKCAACNAYMREYKRGHRARTPDKVAAGLCTASDCRNPTEPGFQHCGSCRARLRDYVRRNSEHVYARHRSMRLRVKAEVFRAYGDRCACCGETLVPFLTIDHVGGYAGVGPRKGDGLYAWAKRMNFPATLRLLCFNCNFALGHHKYCPHGLRAPDQKTGRPPEPTTDTTSTQYRKRQVRRRADYVRLKTQVMAAYGGCRCACCGVTDFEFLSIDHIGGTGAAHRKELTGNARDGRNLYIWLRAQGFPPGYRVLCHNCNFALGHFGICHGRPDIGPAAQDLLS